MPLWILDHSTKEIDGGGIQDKHKLEWILGCISVDSGIISKHILMVWKGDEKFSA